MYKYFIMLILKYSSVPCHLKSCQVRLEHVGLLFTETLGKCVKQIVKWNETKRHILETFMKWKDYTRNFRSGTYLTLLSLVVQDIFPQKLYGILIYLFTRNLKLFKRLWKGSGKC